MSKIKIVVYRENKPVFEQECTSYLMATNGENPAMKCSLVVNSEQNMRKLVTACMASALGILVRKGVAEESIDEFFEQAITEMLTSDQVHHEQENANEFIQ